MESLVHRRVRIYGTLRTAHLERFHALEPAAVLYARRNYDFDPKLLDGLEAHRFTGVGDLFRRLWSSDVRELEINEPLMLASLKLGVVAVAAVRLRGLLSGRRARVVAYAIRNTDPFTRPTARLRSWWRRRAYRTTAGLLLRQVDRLAFGTPGAAEAYAPYLPPARPTTRLIPALPTACDACPPATASTIRQGVVFVGAFDERKGLRQLLAAWPLVRDAAPTAPLRALGKGDLRGLAEDASDRDPLVTTIVDPSREQIHQAMREAKVLVLLSQPSSTWREQVGLPIVEGLSHGCEVVATSETGIARWLEEHGHHVVDGATAGPSEIADAILAGLRSSRPASAIVHDLPEVDGRIAADRWMFSPCEDPSPM